MSGARCEPGVAFPRVEMLHDGTILTQLWPSHSPVLSSLAAAHQLHERLGATLGVAPIPTPDALAALVRSARELTNFAWSALTADCEEARVYLNSLVAAQRAALVAFPEQETNDGK